jgi:FkbM family methyltransferase
MSAYDGLGPPALPRRILDGLRLRASSRLDRVISVGDGSEAALRFRVRSVHEYDRATNAMHNEPGTLRWIRASVRPGDVFYDVGANVGLFALVAAHRAGPKGRVIAFEPHVATVEALLQNISLNVLGERIDVVSSALHSVSGHRPFLYRSLAAASGLSQVDATSDPHGQDVAPVARELKAVAAADDLIAGATIPPADVVKIDVDGNEGAVLAGMRGLLTGPHRPRSLQVEVNPQGRDELLESMSSAGYRETERHLTIGSRRALRDGADPESFGVNVVFEPSA